MAVIAVNELWDDMTISESAADGATGVRKFQVICDTPYETPGVVINATGIPSLGDTYPGSSNVFMTEKKPSRISESREVWFVTCNYKSVLSKEERDRTSHANPLDRKMNIFWKSREITKTYRSSVKRSAFYRMYNTGIESTFQMRSATNSASDFFEPVLEYPFTEWIAVISKNVATIPDWFLTYQNAVNDANFTIDFYGVPKTVNKGCAKLGAISMPVSKQENGTEYVQLSFEIIIRAPRALRNGSFFSSPETAAPEPWDDEILDMGMRRRIVDDDVGTGDPKIVAADVGKWMNILDANGTGVTLPVPFDSLGRPVDTPGYAIEEDQLWYSLVAPYPRKSFSILADYLS